MKLDFLKKHKFQMISFCYVYHPKKKNTGNIQLNNDSHVLHITKGVGILNVDNRTYKIRARSVVAIPPLVPFSISISDDFEMMNIHYNIWLEKDRLLSNVKRLPLVFTPLYFGWCKQMLLKIKRIQEQIPPMKIPDAIVHEIILRHFFENPITDIIEDFSDSRMLKIKEYLENSTFKNFNAKNLEALVFLSRSQINRNFKKLFALSPQKYWEKQRLKNICIHLNASSLAVYEIASLEGFKDQGYFCRWFKKMTGCTPVEYRKKLSSKDFLL